MTAAAAAAVGVPARLESGAGLEAIRDTKKKKSAKMNNFMFFINWLTYVGQEAGLSLCVCVWQKEKGSVFILNKRYERGGRFAGGD